MKNRIELYSSQSDKCLLDYKDRVYSEGEFYTKERENIVNEINYVLENRKSWAVVRPCMGACDKSCGKACINL